MSPDKFPRRIFVTGTDTGVGKSIVCACLMAGLQGKYWKPVQSGIGEETSDTQWIRQVTGLPSSHFYPETYRLRKPLSPHAAAAAEGIRIELEDFRMPETEEYLVVEGAGGIMVPLNEKHLMLDLIKLLKLPVLLVARSGLGTINHTLLSVEQLMRHDLDIFGVIMNGPGNPENRKAVERFGGVKVCAELEPLSHITSETLNKQFERKFIPRFTK